MGTAAAGSAGSAVGVREMLLDVAETVRGMRSLRYRGTSLIRNNPILDPTVGPCLGPYGGPMGGGSFL